MNFLRDNLDISHDTEVHCAISHIASQCESAWVILPVGKLPHRDTGNTDVARTVNYPDGITACLRWDR